MKYSLRISSFLVLPILLFSSMSLHCSVKNTFLSLLVILWNSEFSWVYLSLSPLPFASLLFQLFVKPPQTTTVPSCIHFSLGWFWSLTSVQCYKLPSIVVQAFCLPGLVPWITSTVIIIGEGNGNTLQCSCLENPRDGGAWWAAVYGVVQSRTWLKRLSSSSSIIIRDLI